MAEIEFGGAVPIFRVADLAASIAYYVDILGFAVRWQTAGFACVARDRCSIFLSVGDQGHPGAWTWIGVPDADLVFEHFRAKGAKIRHPPANYAWALEMQIEDLDGNVLRLGSDSKKDRPAGEWLDMDGVRWATSVEGWVRVEGD